MTKKITPIIAIKQNCEDCMVYSLNEFDIGKIPTSKDILTNNSHNSHNSHNSNNSNIRGIVTNVTKVSGIQDISLSEKKINEIINLDEPQEEEEIVIEPIVWKPKKVNFSSKQRKALSDRMKKINLSKTPSRNAELLVGMASYEKKDTKPIQSLGGVRK